MTMKGKNKQKKKRPIRLVSTGGRFAKDFTSFKAASWWLKESPEFVSELISRGIVYTGEFELLIGGMLDD